MSVWYYADAGNVRQGPVEPAELVRLRLQGRLTWETLVWRDGMGDWQPMRDFAGELAQADDRGPLLSTASGRLADAAGSEPSSPYAPPAATVSSDPVVVLGREVVYAGFWKRFAALTIDSLLIGAAYYAVFFAVLLAFGAGSFGALDAGTAAGGGLAVALAATYLAYPLISGLYFVLFETSSQQATLGKMAVGIKVVTLQGARMRRGHGFGRWVSHLLCYLTLYIGYLMVGFTERKQGLHDMAASTLVVDRWAYTDRPDLQRRELGVVTWVVLILGGGMLGLALLGIVAAIAIPALSR